MQSTIRTMTTTAAMVLLTFTSFSQISKFSISLNYGYGLANISRDVERYNRMLNISVKVAKSGKTIRTQKLG